MFCPQTPHVGKGRLHRCWSRYTYPEGETVLLPSLLFTHCNDAFCHRYEMLRATLVLCLESRKLRRNRCAACKFEACQSSGGSASPVRYESGAPLPRSAEPANSALFREQPSVNNRPGPRVVHIQIRALSTDLVRIIYRSVLPGLKVECRSQMDGWVYGGGTPLHTHPHTSSPLGIKCGERKL